MDFTQLRQAFETYCGQTEAVDNAQLALWFNEAQLDLSWELGAVITLQLEQEAGAEYSLPADCLHILGCELDYQLLPGGRLRFDRGGSGRLYYRQLPTEFDGVQTQQQSQLPLGCHYLLALFAVSRYWDVEAEGEAGESNLASRWLSYYYQGKSLACRRLPQAKLDLDAWAVC